MKNRLDKTGLQDVPANKLISELRHRTDVYVIDNDNQAADKTESIIENEQIDYIVLKKCE